MRRAQPMSDEPHRGEPRPPVGLADVAALLLFGLYAVLFWLEHWKGAWPVVDLGGDSGNILSWAVALDHPAAFARDSALADPGALGFYATIHVPLMRLLGPLAGDYGTAWMLLLGPHVFLQVTGFYVLGRVLFRDRLWALLLAVVTSVLVWINLGTYWGAFAEPQPRFTFQALLPWALALALQWRDRPSRWPALMALVGLLMYVHPVSAPAWGFACWLGLWASKAPGTTMRERIGWRTLAAAAFLIVALPFVWLYAGSEASAGTASVDPSVIARAVELSVPAEYRDVRRAVRTFVTIASLPPQRFYWGGAALAILLLALLGGRERALLRPVLLWTTGIVAVSVGLTWADQAQAASRHVPPVQVDLIRGIRYLVPLMLLLVLWPFAALDAKLAQGHPTPLRRIARVVALGGGAIVTIGWAMTFSPTMGVGGALSCWRQGALVCRDEGHRDRAAIFDAVREHTPEGAPMIATERRSAPVLRYYARRPVVHAWRDISVYLYSRRDLLPGWIEREAAKARIRRLPSPGRRFREYMRFAAAAGAEYALIDSLYVPAKFPAQRGFYDGYEVPWRRGGHALVRVAQRRR